MQHYTQSLARIPQTALAAFLFTLFLELAGLVVNQLAGHSTGFDEAAELLLHYPDSIKSVLALLSADLFFLCVSLFFEPSAAARWARRWVFNPSLHTAEHMFSLAIGVLATRCVMGWAHLEAQYPFSPSWAAFGVLLFDFVAGALLAALCNITVEFLDGDDFERLLTRLGRWRWAVLLPTAAVLAAAALVDAIWRYKP